MSRTQASAGAEAALSRLTYAPALPAEHGDPLVGADDLEERLDRCRDREAVSVGAMSRAIGSGHALASLSLTYSPTRMEAG